MMCQNWGRIPRYAHVKRTVNGKTAEWHLVRGMCRQAGTGKHVRRPRLLSASGKPVCGAVYLGNGGHAPLPPAGRRFQDIAG